MSSLQAFKEELEETFTQAAMMLSADEYSELIEYLQDAGVL